ncbi:GNAT family N-acetyltransferase [Geobacter sulfurreducens]|uniref:GNAT family N-acetyltransferase n=1 Tax=Geobacter sulfurreducens TaxID=35554 RepID=UPI0001E3426B|nr:GNAT family protein [Geobacter sulfurreducens]ADI84692.2 acetyltransferase, GNAT family [Geobacter sulfurreducens KN400]
MAKTIQPIQGTGIDLRQIEENDLALVMEWRNRPDIKECFFNRTTLTIDGQLKWYEKYLQDASDIMLMILTKEQEPIGTMALYNIDPINLKAEYGRALIASSAYRGKGYAKEALDLLLQYAFGALKLNRVQLEVFNDNSAAIKLYERCGFVKEGVQREAFYDGFKYRDVLMMSILKNEYKYC